MCLVCFVLDRFLKRSKRIALVLSCNNMFRFPINLVLSLSLWSFICQLMNNFTHTTKFITLSQPTLSLSVLLLVFTFVSSITKVNYLSPGTGFPRCGFWSLCVLQTKRPLTIRAHHCRPILLLEVNPLYCGTYIFHQSCQLMIVRFGWSFHSIAQVRYRNLYVRFGSFRGK